MTHLLLLQVPPSTPFEVYDPHLDAWFSAAPPLTGAVSLSNHALVANQQEGLLIALGGCVTRWVCAASGCCPQALVDSLLLVACRTLDASHQDWATSLSLAGRCARIVKAAHNTLQLDS